MQKARDEKMQEQGASVMTQIGEISEDTSRIETRMQQLSISSHDHQNQEEMDAKGELLDELHKRREANNALHQLCKAVLQCVEHRLDQRIVDIETSEDSSTAAGIFNLSPDQVVGQQDISKVKTTKNSMAIVGHASGVPFAWPNQRSTSGREKEA